MREKHYDAAQERLDKKALMRLANASRAEVTAWSIGAAEMPENLAPMHEVICAVDQARLLLHSVKTRAPIALHAQDLDLTKAIAILDSIFNDENNETRRPDRVSVRLRRHRLNRMGR